MDERFLQLYNSELRHLRSSAGEFAKEYPRVAGQLGIDVDGNEEVHDPYVERLLEGFAYLTARIQRKLDAEFPRVSQGLLETIYPDYLAPTPSMAVVQMQPTLEDSALADGVLIPRGTKLRSRLGKNDRTACEFLTAQDLTLWPIRVADVAFHSSRDLARFNLPKNTKAQSAIRIRLQATAGLSFCDLSLDRLVFYLRGADHLPVSLYENIIANNVGVVLHEKDNMRLKNHAVEGQAIREIGFSADEALLPPSSRGFEGYRLIREYFALPQRFLFFSVNHLAPVIRQIKGNSLELLILLKIPSDDRLGEGQINESALSLYATPAINLFEKRADRVDISPGAHEHLITVDRTRPFDFEIYSVLKVTGHGGERQEFRPFFLSRDDETAKRAYYTLHREERPLTVHERNRTEKPPSYLGSLVSISLVDAANSPYHSELRELGVKALCTNRHLPLTMARGLERGDFEVEINQVETIRCITGPTRPLPSYAQGDIYWRLISHLSLNYLSLVDNDEEEGAAALRELLSLYVTEMKKGADQQIQKRQIEGISHVRSRPITKRMIDGPGRISFVRGLEIELQVNESAFEGFGVFILATVLEKFMAKQISMNSFTQTVLSSEQRGLIHRWPVQVGKKVIL